MPEVGKAGNPLDDERFLNYSEMTRDEHRLKIGRLTFDCFNAHAHGDRVNCVAGKVLSTQSGDGTALLLAVLKGRTPAICKDCTDFSGD